MKKIIIITAIMVMALSGCKSTGNNNIENTTNNIIENNDKKDIVIDYKDAEAFENDLNNGVDVSGKIVQFEVLDYLPDSELGYNTWAGKHLNFISEDDINSAYGDKITAKVDYFDDCLGSWVIHYTLINLDKGVVETTTVKKIKVIDLTKYSKSKAKKWCKKNGIKYRSDTEYSEKIKHGNAIRQSVKPGSEVEIGSKVTVIYSLGKKPTQEELNALIKAESYSDDLHMSKKAIYDQLTSKYGEDFPDKVAQYAIDNLKANYKKNALEKAKSYYKNMAMSKNAIYDQLVSEYGEQFTAEEAQYAIEHLDD